MYSAGCRAAWWRRSRQVDPRGAQKFSPIAEGKKPSLVPRPQLPTSFLFLQQHTAGSDRFPVPCSPNTPLCLTGNAEGARGGLDAECNTAWITHRRKVRDLTQPCQRAPPERNLIFPSRAEKPKPLRTLTHDRVRSCHRTLVKGTRLVAPNGIKSQRSRSGLGCVR